MRIQLLLTAFWFFTSASAQEKITSADLRKLSWLNGQWERTNAKPGRSGVEIWEAVSATEMKGRGISLKGTDTTFVEKLRVVSEQGSLFYVSDVPENTQPIYFKITGISASGFVCENPQHDFPKKITYNWEGTTLKATISGDGKSTDYFFKRKN